MWLIFTVTRRFCTKVISAGKPETLIVLETPVPLLSLMVPEVVLLNVVAETEVVDPVDESAEPWPEQIEEVEALAVAETV